LIKVSADHAGIAVPGRAFPLPAKEERFLLYVLAAIQFTHILDFMIVMPLGPRLMGIFAITPAQFGFIVSAYTFSAGLFGLVAAWFIDRFDRKRALLWLYGGFAIGTLLCAVAPNYYAMVAARFLAGGFGGISGATILAIIADAIPPNRRGAAMGTLFSAFSLASIAGVPAGLYLANHLGWHAPFFLLAFLSVAVLVMAAKALPPVREHLSRGKPQPWTEMKSILRRGNHWLAFALTITMTMAGFLVVPYLSPSLVANVGLTNEQLPLIYLFGGAATFFSIRWLGRVSDRLGLLRVFIAVSVLAMGPILVITHLPRVPVWAALLTSTCFMVLTSGRFIPGMAMVTNSVEGRYRGGFMSLNSAVQQFASGAASLIAGAIIVEGAGHRLEHYGVVGLIGAGCILASIALASRLKAA
jgi:predicted MFS family arabinose efflux permease